MERMLASVYSLVDMESSHEKIQKRCEGMKNYLETNLDIDELIALYFQINTDCRNSKLYERLKDADLMFDHEHKREIALIAGVLLLELLNDRDLVEEVILSFLCQSLFREQTLIKDMNAKIQEKFLEITSNLRENQMIKKHESAKISELQVFEDVEVEEEEEKEEILWGEETIEIINKSFTTVAAKINALHRNQLIIRESLDLYKEESNLLSWLFGGWSNDLNEKLSQKINANEISIVLGKELADLVSTASGPYPAKQFLVKMLSYCGKSDDKISLLDLVEYQSDDWKEQVLSTYPLYENELKTPILSAISHSQKVDEKGAWKYTYKTSTGIEPENTEFDALIWAYQFYLELLLVKLSEGEA